MINNFKKIDKSDKYKLGENFTTNPIEGSPNNSNTSIFFDPQSLFVEGINKEQFINKYKELMAISIFGIEQNETNDSVDLSSISDEELATIAEAAERYFDALDKDGNEILSEDEINIFASRDGDSNGISDDDIKSITDELFSEETPAPEAAETPEAPAAGTNSVNNGNSTGKGGGSSYNTTNNNSDSGVEKSATLEELQSQKKDKQSELDTARSDLKTVYEQGNKDVNDAKKAYDEAVQNDKEIADELKEEQRINSEAITVKEGEIGALKSELVDVNADIANYTSTISAKTSEISALKTSLENLKATKTEDSEKQSEKQSKISEIESKIEQAETEKEEAQTKLDEANKRKTEIEKEISTKEGELKELNDKKAEIDTKILETCSQETKDALEAYKKAQEDADSAVKAAEDNISALQKDIDELDKLINEKQAIKTQNEYRISKLNKTYTLNGKEYFSLMSQQELDSFLATEWANGNYNHDSNCLAMSNQYCADIIKRFGLKASSVNFESDNQEDVEAKAREALDNGYPATLHVSTKKGTRHYATAVGYRIEDDGSIEFLLADNVQGVGITACGKNGYRHLITGYSTPYKNQNYGYTCIYYT